MGVCVAHVFVDQTNNTIIVTLLLSFVCRKIGLEKCVSRNLKVLEISVAESDMQMAKFRAKVPQNEEELVNVEERVLIPVKRCLECADS